MLLGLKRHVFRTWMQIMVRTHLGGVDLAGHDGRPAWSGRDDQPPSPHRGPQARIRISDLILYRSMAKTLRAAACRPWALARQGSKNFVLHGPGKPLSTRQFLRHPNPEVLKSIEPRPTAVPWMVISLMCPWPPEFALIVGQHLLPAEMTQGDRGCVLQMGPARLYQGPIPFTQDPQTLLHDGKGGAGVDPEPSCW